MSGSATATRGSVARGPARDGVRRDAFEVHLDVFDGPFDLLLGLISKHKLDITEVALAQVTDEFVAYVRAAGETDLEQLSSFLVVAATLLDLKAARLLPAPEDPDDEDVALLEARDLLFARLLQYRAYKVLSRWLLERFETEDRWVPRQAALSPEWKAEQPDLVFDIGPVELARLAADALTPREPPVVTIEHLHLARVDVPEHMEAVLALLADRPVLSFAEACAGCGELLEVVARFLALLELFRNGQVGFEQAHPLGPLQIRRRDGDLDASPTDPRGLAP